MTPGPVPPFAVLEASRVQAGMSFQDLWIAFFALGGAAGPELVRAFLGGSAPLDRRDYDVLAHAINERFVDQGLNHPVPYHDEIG